MLRFCLLIVSILFLVLTQVASAQERGIRISPALLDIVLDETEDEKQIQVTIENLTNNTVQLALSAIDFRQANETGGIDFSGVDSQDYSYSLASFISFETSSVTIEKGSSETVTIKVMNRPDLSPGGHYAAIVGHQVMNLVDEADRTATVRPAVSSLVLLRKTGGEVFSISLLETNWPKTIMFGFPNRQLELLFQNEGNVHLIPYGTVTISDMFGHEITRGTINNSSSIIFPEARRWLDVRLNPISYKLPVSFVTMNIKGRDSIDKTTFVYQQTALLINPLILIVLTGLIGGSLYYRKRKNAKEA